MEISFENYLIRSLTFDGSGPIEENDFSLNYSAGFRETDSNSYVVVFDVLIANQDHNYSLKFQFIAKFKSSESIDDEFKSSHFVEVNSPAIAYPYLRAFVSNFTLNSGYDPIVLPTINFVELSKLKNPNQ